MRRSKMTRPTFLKYQTRNSMSNQSGSTHHPLSRAWGCPRTWRTSSGVCPAWIPEIEEYSRGGSMGGIAHEVDAERATVSSPRATRHCLKTPDFADNSYGRGSRPEREGLCGGMNFQTRSGISFRT